MIRNYIKIAIRNLWKDRTFTALNIIGLSIAFGVAILLSMASLFDLSYDRFHENGNQLYQIYATNQTVKGSKADASTPVPFADALQKEVPGVEKITRYLGEDVQVLHDGNLINLDARYVDPDFFTMFSFPVKEGKSSDLLESKSEVVLTAKAAKMIFGKVDAVGKTIDLLLEGKEKPVTVSAIMEDIKPQSSITFEIAINFKNQPGYAQNLNNWSHYNHSVYLQLQKGMTPAQFEKNTRAFTALHFEGDIKNAKRDGVQPDENGQYKQERLLPLKDVHFASEKSGILTVSRLFPYLILGIAFLILFIACVNFVNMRIAKSTQRLREIGMRKTLGAGKTQLFFQFWCESIFVFVISLCIGMLLSVLLLDPFKNLFSTETSFSTLTSPWVLAGCLLGILVITLIAGGYPALLLSRLGTLQALKSKLDVDRGNGMRNVLIVVQFSIAILMISGTLVLYGQLDYMRHANRGFDEEQVLAFPLNGKKNDRADLQLLHNELQDKPGILSITGADNILGRDKNGSTSTSVLGFDFKGRRISTHFLTADYDYAKTLGLELKEGRDFSKQFATDSLAVVINEAMARELNLKDPINKKIMDYTIIGVLKDYNFQGFDRKIEPITIFMDPSSSLNYAYIKVAPQNLARSYDQVKSAWKTIKPNAEFQASFLDENIERTLKKEKVMTTIITSGSILAIVLSCIGLFAISLLTVSQRRKEIGVRKVVGAGVSSITVLLTKDFLRLVGIAFLIAAPIAWWAASQWLQNYSYRIDLSPWIFIAAGGIALVIAVTTISVRTVRAALQNPVESLRTE